jgi:homoserine dehydrogenase
VEKEGWLPAEAWEDIEGIFKSAAWHPRLGLGDVLRAFEPGVMVECTPTDLKTGEPGLGHILRALESGWDVVTANKGPLVVDFQGLTGMARMKGLSLKFSGAAAAALPTIDLGRWSLLGAEILEIKGILNGTTNFILSRMEDGLDYAGALKEAQERGIAEADPSLDVEGWDTAAKILIIANALLGTDFSLSEIKIEGISNLSPGFLEKTAKNARRIKLLGRVYREAERWQARVELVPLLPSDILYHVCGTNKGISFDTDTMGQVTLVGGKSDPRGAAAALLKDIINIYCKI